MSAIIILLLLLEVSVAQSNNVCSSKMSCSDCIITPTCVWCSTLGKAQCYSQNDFISNSTCNQQYLIQPASQVLKSNVLSLNEENQISLKDISVKLRVGEPLEFRVSVKAAEDFPLDVYMLMDLSSSFTDDLQTVKAIAPQLPLTLRSVSSDFFIGFGTYVDKPVLPFISRLQQLASFSSSIAIPFAYQHVVNLTNSSELFNSSVQETVISTNVDNPEGTLDAMLQAIVCKDVVGWRNMSRKILLVMTDDILHTAGDGALSGIVKPNNGLCHTEYDPSINRVHYTAALTHDYPSVELVRQKLQDANVNLIFAIANINLVLDFFNTTVSPLLDATTIALTESASNLEDVLRESYFRAVANARLRFNAPNHISANITANCPPGSTYLPTSSQCSGIGNGTVHFNITLTLKECTYELENEQIETLQVIVPSFGQFDVHVSAFCICACEDEVIHLSPQCNNNGAFTCGLCLCDEGWSGSLCSCSTVKCPLGPNSQECSGSQRGKCQCGECVCSQPSITVPGVDNPRIEGDACECSNYECDTGSEGMVCSGRGICTCSNSTYTCQCNVSSLTDEPFSGDSCQCSSDHCINPSKPGSLPCNQPHGNCDRCKPQGQACTCNEGYIGRYCETFLSATVAGQCDATDFVQDCIRCYSEAAPTCTTCVNYNALGQDMDNFEIAGTVENSTTRCSFRRGDCVYTYYVGVTLERQSKYAVFPSSCLPIPSWAIGILVLVILLILGIVILISIKLVVMYLDYKEFRKFRKETLEADFSKNANPIYHAPTVTYKNVAYGSE